MTSRSAMRQCFAAVTTEPAKILNLENYGLDVGCKADMVLLQAADTIEAIRLKATRLAVIKADYAIFICSRGEFYLEVHSPFRLASKM
eukprot:gene28959-35304_t